MPISLLQILLTSITLNLIINKHWWSNLRGLTRIISILWLTWLINRILHLGGSSRRFMGFVESLKPLVLRNVSWGYFFNVLVLWWTAKYMFCLITLDRLSEHFISGGADVIPVIWARFISSNHWVEFSMLGRLSCKKSIILFFAWGSLTKGKNSIGVS